MEEVTRRFVGLSGESVWRTVAFPEQGAPSLWLADGPHGLRKSRDPDQLGLSDPLPATCYPTAAALAASWDRSLVEQVGRAIGREAREQGVHIVLGPGLNLKRHPLGGRNFEYFSEDPLLSGALAAAWVRGCQSEGVGACLKHFVANNQERNRMVLDAVIDERTLHELYLRGFGIAVRESAPAAVMAAYNLVNGVYATEHPLVAEVLRGEWGFDGLVVSDWGAVSDRVAALRAGLDLEMPGTGDRQHEALSRGLAEGRIDRSHVDAAVSRLVAAAVRFGASEPGPASETAEERHALARRAAAACCVLLKNDGVLPLSDAPIGLVGALAEEPRFQGAGSSGVEPVRVVGVREALEAARGPVRFARGYRLDDVGEPALRDEALALAAEVPLVVVVAGLPAHCESEGFDRSSLDLPADQVALIEGLAAAPARVVVVLCNGSPVAMPWADGVDAILEAYLGGQAVGEGVVDVLTGAVDPSGRLPETVVDRVESHLAHAAWPREGRQVRHREALYVGYRWFDSAGLDVRFPFGHGLSYTSFAYRDVSADVREDGVSVRCRVTNTGLRAGTEVVQVYVHRPESRVYRPAQWLAAFDRVRLEPGASAEVELGVPRDAFAIWASGWRVEPGIYEIRVGASSRDVRGRVHVELTSDDEIEPDEAPEAYRRPDPTRPPDDAAFATLYGRDWPPELPPRPFHRNSTLADIRGTWIGGLLYRLAVREATSALAGSDRRTMARLAEATVSELPLRGLVVMARAMSWRQLDALVAVLDGRPWRALTTLGAPRPRDVSPRPRR